jgi:hypothetical protein
MLGFFLFFGRKLLKSGVIFLDWKIEAYPDGLKIGGFRP